MQKFCLHHVLCFLSSQRDSGVTRKTPPSAKQHYMKQARYFPGQNITNTQTHQAMRNPTFGRKGSYGVTGNALGGSTYVPSFGGGTQSKGVGVGGM